MEINSTGVFEVMKRNYPDLCEAYLRYCKNHESTKKTQLWSFLSVVAGALERKVWVDRNYYTLYPNLYVFIIGRSGMIKKSTTTAMAVNLLKEVPGIKFMSDRLTAASLIDQMGEAQTRFAIRGREHRQAALYAYGSEAAVMLGEVFGSILELLTTFYDCQPNDWRKPWIYKPRHQDAVKVHGPCLNILAASTKEWLVRSVGVKEMQGGFASRCIFVVENNLPEQLVAWPEFDAGMHELKHKIQEDLEQISRLSGQFTVMPKFIQRFTQWYNHHMRKVMPNLRDNRFSGYFSRKGDMLIKLSMVRAVTLSDELMLKEEHLIWSLEQMDELEPDMLRAFTRDQSGSPVKPDTKARTQAFDVYQLIKKRPEGMLFKHIANEFMVEPAEIKGFLENLIGMGKIERETDEKGRGVYKLPTLEEDEGMGF